MKALYRKDLRGNAEIGFVGNQRRSTYVGRHSDIFENPGKSSMTPTFWRRHDHGAVLTRWAKLLMMVQAAISLIVIAVLAARAINTLN